MEASESNMFNYGSNSEAQIITYKYEAESRQSQQNYDRYMSMEVKDEPMLQSKPHGKKDSLKFCRRINKNLKKFQSSELMQKLEEFFAQLVETICNLLGAEICAPVEFRSLYKGVFENAWLNFKETLSYYKNRKISLVTADEWHSLFSDEKFLSLISNLPDALRRLIRFATGEDEITYQMFIIILQKLLWLLFKVSLQTIIHLEMLNDPEMRSEIPNIEHFSCMTLAPSLYKHYNHTAGKFALECCDRCKICRSTAIPENYYEILTQARENLQKTRAFYSNLNGSLASISICQIQMLFSYWAANSSK